MTEIELALLNGSDNLQELSVEDLVAFGGGCYCVCPPKTVNPYGPK